ncbi:transporter [Nitrogeniibacter mangrovi]|uniref:Transporter n=1 Tax=Nitrogeniibacter mangrovi TaxID=2016596 RepID=A0A6C1B6S1_9RHOO|nr:transporter [Nitrogeniibacter mangrovi]QID17944.1 transporter [Nitrogeniibacter mangrovi]
MNDSRGTGKRLTTQRRTARGLLAAMLGALSMACPTAQAVDVDAGDYTALPDGTNLALLYYQHATRDALIADGHKANLNAGLDSDVGILRGVHFMDVGGYIVDPQFLLPFGKLKAKDDLSALGDADGMGDLILAATVWLVNDPKSSTYFGITPFLFLPTGDYDKHDSLNLGENRWKFALQAGYITQIAPKLLLDVVADVTVYGDNDDFGPTGVTLKQDPSVQLQGFLRYQMSDTWDLRAGISHTTGGETEVAGVSQNDSLRTTKMTLGTAVFVTPTVQLMANYGRDIDVRNGLREDNRLNLRILKVF